MKWLIKVFSILVLLTSAQSAPAALFCADAFLEKSISELPPRHHIRVQERRYHYYMGTELAATFTYNYKGQTIEIKNVKVLEGFQVQGVSKRLFRTLIERHPEAQFMSTILIDDNSKAYTHARKVKGLSPEKAVMETPAYKARAYNGFSRILKVFELSLEDGSLFVQFKVARDE